MHGHGCIRVHTTCIPRPTPVHTNSVYPDVRTYTHVCARTGTSETLALTPSSCGARTSLPWGLAQVLQTLGLVR